jgi:hypothetical protein
VLDPNAAPKPDAEPAQLAAQLAPACDLGNHRRGAGRELSELDRVGDPLIHV